MNQNLFIVSKCMALAGVLLLSACIGPQARLQDGATYVLTSNLPAQSDRVKSVSSVLVSPMRAHPGFDTPRMAYRRESNQIAYYANNRWIEAPARMLTPLVIQALEASNAFSAVVQAPGSVHTALRLDTELVNLSQDFEVQPSHMQLVLRAQLVDTQAQTILASRTFAARTSAASEDARGGVTAANQMLPGMLTQLADWVAQMGVRKP